MTSLRLDARSLLPAKLTPPHSKSDEQRVLLIEQLLGRRRDVEPDAPSDVRVLSAGLKQLASGSADIDCADGGAPFRLLLGQAAITDGHFRFSGTERLARRPRLPLIEALTKTLRIEVQHRAEHWPVVVAGSTARAPEPVFRVDAHESSQFASSLALTAAGLVLREQRPWRVEVAGPMTSPGYFTLTVAWLERAGFVVSRLPNGLRIERGPVATPALEVPGDWSSIAYLLMISWRSGGSVTRLDFDASHPDQAVVQCLENVGLMVSAAGRVSGTPVRGVTASAAACPDLIPTLGALACVLPAPSRFDAVSVLRGKESDRLDGLRALVESVGAVTRLDGDVLHVEPPTQVKHDFVVDTRGDHRLAMSGATLAVLLGAQATVSDSTCVTKSFPGFWDELRRAGVGVFEA